MYADLRNLQEVITAKAVWPTFQAEFGSKEHHLATRFDQLAELRNAIRHSRPVSDVTREDGEAALMWFDQILAA